MSTVPVAQDQPPRSPRGSTSRVLHSVELFAGAGGLTLGLKLAEFELICLVEQDPQCCDTLRTNGLVLGLDPYNLIEDQIEKISLEHLYGIGVLAAGAPCQPFSSAGHGRGHSDQRNMFPQVIRAVREARPRAFVIENVRGLLFDRARDYFLSVLARLRTPSRESADHMLAEDYHKSQPEPSQDDEYRVYHTLLDAADYGLAQHRPRLFVVGLAQSEASWTWPEPTHSRDALVVALLEDDYWERHDVDKAVRDRVRKRLPNPRLNPQGEPWTTLRDVLATLGPPGTSVESAVDPAHVFVPGARLYRRHTGSPLDWVAKTVKSGVHGSPGGEHIVLLDDGSHRYLTVRECAVLQGFPATYELPKLRTPAMRQLGNAVPVTVAEAVGSRLREVLRNDRARGRGGARDGRHHAVSSHPSDARQDRV